MGLYNAAPLWDEETGKLVLPKEIDRLTFSELCGPDFVGSMQHCLDLVGSRRKAHNYKMTEVSKNEIVFEWVAKPKKK